MREQATVLTVYTDGAVTLVSDDGHRSRAERAAVEAGDWLAPRPGQRVDVVRADDGTVSAMLVPGM